MKRGELYRVYKSSVRDPKRSRVFVVLARQVLIDSRFVAVACAPVFTAHDGLSTQVAVGVAEGLKHPSSIHCDEIVSLLKTSLTDYVGALSEAKLGELRAALLVALDLD